MSPRCFNVSALLYHAVCPTKYRRAVITRAVITRAVITRAVITDEVEAVLRWRRFCGVSARRVCLDIGNRYEITFLEIGADQDHVHFLVQSVPMYSPKKIVQIIKR